jgi:transcriptional regulator GlxA family with amidase domain
VLLRADRGLSPVRGGGGSRLSAGAAERAECRGGSVQTDQAPRILAVIGNRDGDVVAAATALLTDRLADPWSVAGLAAAVRTSESTLFARFRQVTGMSPVQYLRRLRLGEARRRMIVLGETAAQAAVAVGYRSASHFSRDYRALHGRPPAADAGRARELLAQGEIAIA